jgi:hypothetical protein
MPRLYRPHIPIEVRCRVILRQIGEMWPEQVIAIHKKYKGGLVHFLEEKLASLAILLRCEVQDLRLDHDPALATRRRIGEGNHTKYFPDANDPDHLIYREKHAHHIKTNVRGDGAQYPDRVLIKRERKRQRAADPSKSKMFHVKHPKRKWPTRKMKSASRWPKRRVVL